MVALNAFAEILKPLTGANEIEPFAEVVPGSGFHAYIFNSSSGRIFVKVRPQDELEVFLSEVKGLAAIAGSSGLALPRVFGCSIFEENAFLAMECLELVSHTAKSQADLGLRLAEMHSAPAGDLFGFECPSWLGKTRQDNSFSGNWVEFLQKNRLEPQLKMLEENFRDAELVREGFKLIARLDTFFEGIELSPSLLHGDLWHGNTGLNTHGKPVVFDPAVYYGHSEMDLGLIALFGGFWPEFFEAYHSIRPKIPGHAERLAIYELYHSLNHYNLFGPSYRDQCLLLLQRC